MVHFSAIVIDHISNLYAVDDDTAIVFAYYNYQNPNLENTEGLLGNIIKQLCWKLEEVPTDLLTFYRTYSSNARNPGLEKLKEIFLSLCKHFKQTFIVIDALDECKATERTKILHLTTVLCQSLPSVKIFITSRKERDLEAWFSRNATPVIEVEAVKVDEDIKAYVISELDHRIDDNLLRIEPTNQVLKAKIVDTLSEKAEGM